ncbi:hypothetical protein CHUAL_000034 [Chamberlinius hualienensis]
MKILTELSHNIIDLTERLVKLMKSKLDLTDAGELKKLLEVEFTQNAVKLEKYIEELKVQFPDIPQIYSSLPIVRG